MVYETVDVPAVNVPVPVKGVPEADKVMLFEPGLRLPLVRVSKFETARLLFKLKVAGVALVLLKVRLVNAVTVEGMSIGPAFDPPKLKLEEALGMKLVAVPPMVGPFRDNVLAPTLNKPFVKVKVPAMARFDPSETDPLLVLLMVRLFRF